MDEYLAFAKDLVRQGGQVIKDNFEQSVTIEFKADSSPVTEIDKQINNLIADAIEKTYPGHGLLGEESDFGDGTEEFQWLCDPIDGTKCFILGIPQCTCILALTKGGEILLSAIYNPFTDRLYHAVKGQGAFCNDQPIHVSDQPLKGAYVLIEASSFLAVAGIKQKGGDIESVAGTGYKCAMLASGYSCAVLKTKGDIDFHDVGPSSLIVEEAGGKVTAYDGSQLRYDSPITGSGIILSNGVTHDDLLEIVSKA
jgi:fructose-1,6-bisphosphatase/inositol monophosphatase family enzyme